MRACEALTCLKSLPMNWKDAAVKIQWNIQPFIDGRYRPSNSTEFFNKINPASEMVLCQCPVGTALDVDEAVRVARRRFEEGCWSELTSLQRADVLRRLADLIVAHKSELALLDTLEIGKPIQAALHDAASLAPTRLRSYARLAESLLGVSAPLQSRTLSFNTYEPRGVVGAITPWNFPVVNAVVKIAPALAAGNAVVLKPSELSASSALKLAELALEAGVPEGVFNVVPGLGSTVGMAVALHPDVDLLSFTGSTVTGRKLLELSGRSNGKPVLLECGGKSPQVVFDDVSDLDRVADAAVESVLWNQGQVCSARTRLLVHAKVKDLLLKKIVGRARQYRPGDPLDEATTFGPLASPTQRDRVKAYIEQGINAGAEAVLLGAIQETGGCYVSPTIFDRVESHMPIAREEIFGPVLCVQCFETEEEAIALANGTDYGLAATVWTQDIGRGRRMARAIKAGDIQIRTSREEGPASGIALSHEPQKASGFGAEIGLEGLQSYSTLKSVSFRGA
jgi:acyl-CoA reductase-like NAD-dependent aldehyde dehydrogenase